jgi:predicted DNA-binding protein (UPF0251 family)
VTPVITARLFERLTPLERLLYTGDGRTERLLTRAYWLTAGQPLDGWDPEDFVAFALEKLARYPEASAGALSMWMGQEVVRRRNRAARVDTEPVIDAGEQSGFTPTRLPEDVVAWLHEHLRPRSAEAVRIHSEEGLTIAEAADRVGIDRQTLTRALDKLRKVME